MLISWLLSLLIWISIIINPDLVGYIIWGLFVFIWISTLLASFAFNKYKKWQKKDDWDYFTFGNYKIYKNKK